MKEGKSIIDRKFIWACDFDGTIVKNAFPNIGEFLEGFKDGYLCTIKPKKIHVVLWTVRHGDYLRSAEKFLFDNGIGIDSINALPPAQTFSPSPKIYYDHLTDDRAGFNGDWGREFALIDSLYNE